jgi:hypothetical protein
MNGKPTRTFVYLSLMMVFLMVLGLILVGFLAAANRPLSPLELPETQMFLNPTTEAELQRRATLTAITSKTFTPIPYTADMSLTAPMPQRFITPIPTITPPYDAELFATREWLMRVLQSGGGPTQFAEFWATEQALIATYQGTVVPTPTQAITWTVTPTFTQPPYSGCGWQWAQQDLPEVASTALGALTRAGMAYVDVRAEAYGENCFDIVTNEVNYFAAMTTDFYLTAPAGDFSKLDALGDFVQAVYEALITLPADELPARLGYLDITFTHPDGTKRLRTMFDQIKAALADGQEGEALLTALGGLR